MNLADLTLVPLDGSPTSEQILSFVVRRARERRVVLLHLVDDAALRILAAPPAPGQDEAALPIDPQVRRRLEVARSRLALAGATVELEVRLGQPAEGIVTRAEGLGASLIAMASHGRTGLRRLVRGSVAEEVLRTTDVPLLLMTPSARAESGRLARILVPLDGTERSAAVVPAVRDLASTEGAEVILLEVLPGELDGTDGLERSRAELEAHGLEVRICRKPGEDPAREILVTATEEDVDLVALCTRGRRGLERLVPGSVAAQVLRACRVPLLVVRKE